jgi:hypothetical protein
MTNLYNSSGKIDRDQDIYDAFNDFIFSTDRNIFNKMWAKMYFYEMTKDLHGDIVECGVFKGSGMSVWLKLLDMYEPNSIKKVIGFDMFDPGFVDNLEDIEKHTMQQVFDRCNIDYDDVSLETINNRLLNAEFKHDKFELVKGDVSFTTEEFVVSRPGAKISILYLDLDLEEPTYNVLYNLWDRVVPGGVIVFDEYCYHKWTETAAADNFLSYLDFKYIKENGFKLSKLNIKSPTAYIIK